MPHLDVWSYLRAATELTRQVNTPGGIEHFVEHAPSMVRALSEAVGVVYTEHRPGSNGQCEACGRPAPCPTRQNLARALIREHPAPWDDS